MAWIGKILGGGIGMMLGGPLGALLGATLGHSMFDQQAGSPGQISGIEQRNAIFFTAIFAMLGKMAKADGVVCKDEIRVVEQFMEHNLKLDDRTRQFAIGIFNEAKETDVPFSAYARQFADVFRNETQLRTMFYELLFTLAMADGVMHPAEDAILKQAPSLLNVPESLYQSLRQRLVKDLAPLYAILGVTESASDTDIKKAYRKLATEYHPDKIIAQGLPDDFRLFAEDKFKQINEAYQTVMENRQDQGA